MGLGIDGNGNLVNEIQLRKRSLEEILHDLPATVVYKGREIGFCLMKLPEHYSCVAVRTNGDEFYLNVVTKEMLLFKSNDPCMAVCLMVGWLRFERLIP